MASVEQKRCHSVYFPAQCSADVISIALAGIPCIIMLLVAQPYKRGFYCDDETLMHPYRKETVPVITVGIFSVVVPIILVVFRERRESCKERYFCGKPKADWFIRSRKFLMPYFFGCCLTQVITDIGKYSIGRLRPHFLTVCQPMIQNCSIETGFLYEDGVCKGSDLAAITEARLSFPSGHASMSFYSVVWLMIYLQYRFHWLRYWLIKPFIQGLLFVIAYFVSLSRISDYMHHWSDVLAGSVLGTADAFIVFFLATDREVYMSKGTRWPLYPSQNLKHKHDDILDIETGTSPSEDQILGANLEYTDDRK